MALHLLLHRAGATGPRPNALPRLRGFCRRGPTMPTQSPLDIRFEKRSPAYRLPIGVMSPLSTAQVSTMAGVHRDTLLRWLRRGLVPEPGRDERGWRSFSYEEATAIMAFAGRRPVGDQREYEAIGRLRAVDWAFATAKTGYLTHGLHPYPAKFIPQIPNALIQELSAVGDCVADIFCGSGTTLLEALQLKRNALGIDANPLATLISKAKTTPLASADLESVHVHETACRRLFENIQPLSDDLFHDGLPFRSTAWRPDLDVCQFWFEPHVVEELSELRHLIDQIPSATARTFCYVAFSAIIVGVSRQDSDTRYVRRAKQIRPRDTVQRYLRQLAHNTAALMELNDLLEDRFSCEIVNADVLRCPEVGPIDLVVASPPYPNAYSYHLYHRLRLLWLGIDPNEFKSVEIGSHRKYSSKGPNRATCDTFRQELGTIFQQLRNLLSHAAYVCLVIGDSKIDGRRIDNADLIAQAGVSNGYREVARMDRAIASTRKSLNPRIGGIETETILILRKR